MHKLMISAGLMGLFLGLLAAGGTHTDIITTSKGDVKITFVGHASLVFEFNKQVIYVDPFSGAGDYTNLPKADLILVSHQHGDHLDAKLIAKLKKQGTRIIMAGACKKVLKEGMVMANGDKKEFGGIGIEAVPAYNIEHKRPDGNPFHPKGEGNGYILTFADKRIYIGGDTEVIPEMKNFKNIYAAILPANLPYTMSPKMVAEAARIIQPKILYPYHFKFGKSDLEAVKKLVQAIPGVKIRIFK